jgi:hypothetical protein
MLKSVPCLHPPSPPQHNLSVEHSRHSARGSQGLTRRLQVLDWGVSSATLREVFINLARQTGLMTVASLD